MRPTIEAPIGEVLERLKQVFIEMPDAPLNVSEASRLSGVDPFRCEPLLDVLVSDGFLTRGANARFHRPTTA